MIELRDPCIIHLQTNREDIVYLDHIMEGYSHLGIVTTVDAKEGLVCIRVTEDTKEEVLNILKNFPVSIKFLK